MGGAYKEILLSSSVLVLPMLALSITLLGLIYTRLLPDEHSAYYSYSLTDLGNAYYVNFSATRLVFIARLSVGAVVAESFESPVLGEDARDVAELFAERRGLGKSARRIALGKRGIRQGAKPALPGDPVGGRGYTQVVWATRKGEGGGVAVI